VWGGGEIQVDEVPAVCVGHDVVDVYQTEGRSVGRWMGREDGQVYRSRGGFGQEGRGSGWANQVDGECWYDQGTFGLSGRWR
jgi:hypothetical protein